MTSFLPDTSVLVAAVCSWHQDHLAAVRELEVRSAKKQQMVIAAHALVETYAVLTRLPAPYRLLPRDAHALILTNFVSNQRIVALDAEATRALLDRLATEGIAGGQAYDGVIAASARRAKANVLLTFNDADFEPFAEEELEIAIPGR